MPDAHTAPRDTPEVTIFHNPSCSHSRGALGILEEQSIDHEVVEYLITPPSRETLEMIISKLINPVPELIRTSDKKFVALGADPNAYTSAEQVIEFLLLHPELMQRPIVIKGDRAVIARPSERAAEVLNSYLEDSHRGVAVVYPSKGLGFSSCSAREDRRSAKDQAFRT
jgi:arsenate reductase